MSHYDNTCIFINHYECIIPTLYMVIKLKVFKTDIKCLLTFYSLGVKIPTTLRSLPLNFK